MDLRRAFAALLIAVACIAATGSAELPIREARWLTAEARLQVLTSAPGFCVTLPTDSDGINSFALGEAAFRNPLLLGGQAARVGLSCASCHPNGRRNEAFSFPGLSGEPGTADVTSSILSSKRGDGQFNPKRIPDLALDAPKISRDPQTDILRSFIHGQIVEEFDGAEPPTAILDGLTTYVRSLRATDCDNIKRIPISLEEAADHIKSALDLSQVALVRGDRGSVLMMISSARASLGRIFERFAGATLAKERTAILNFDRRLQDQQIKLASGEQISIEPLAAQADSLLDTIAAAEPKSLYNPKRLAQALGG